MFKRFTAEYPFPYEAAFWSMHSAYRMDEASVGHPIRICQAFISVRYAVIGFFEELSLVSFLIGKVSLCKLVPVSFEFDYLKASLLYRSPSFIASATFSLNI
jgi:hypothetical protein